MPESQHTPTPYDIDDDERPANAAELGIVTAIVGGRDASDSGVVAYITDIFTNEPGDTARPNAAFIVRACNSHRDLLGALKGIAAMVRTYRLDCEDREETAEAADWHKVETLARAAIAAATAE